MRLPVLFAFGFCWGGKLMTFMNSGEWWSGRLRRPRVQIPKPHKVLMKRLKSIALDKEPLISLMTVNGHPNLLSMVGMQASFKRKNCSISCSEIEVSVRCSSNMSICFFLHGQLFRSRDLKLGWEVFRLTGCSFIEDNLRRNWWQILWLAFRVSWSGA